MAARRHLLLVCALPLCALLVCGCDHDEAWVCAPEAVSQPVQGVHVDRARALADAYIKRHPAAKVEWDWEEAVLMNGVAALYDATGEARYLTYVRTWLDHHMAAGYTLQTSDTVAPTAAAAELYRRTCEPRYRDVIDEVYDYLTLKAPRGPEGGVNHLGPGMKNVPQIWIDSLYMFGTPMLRGGRYTGQAKMTLLVAEQMEAFSKVLQDQGSDLYYHASINQILIPTKPDPAFWARGNSWVLVSMAELLAAEPGRHPAVRARFDRLAPALLERQDLASSLWQTVLDKSRPTYVETSGSALIIAGAAHALRHGLIETKHRARLDRAISALDKKIISGTDGLTVTGTSVGTMPGEFENYANVPVADDVPFGVGGVLLALVEYQRLVNGQ